MSVELSLYIGPYVEVTVPVQDAVKDNCRDPKNCPQPIAGYCVRCGIHADKRHETYQLDRFDNFGLIGDALCCTSVMSNPHCITVDGKKIRRYYLVQNCPWEFHINTENEEVVEEWNRDPSLETAWFATAFADEIRTLSDAGFNPVVKYGLVKWYR